MSAFNLARTPEMEAKYDAYQKHLKKLGIKNVFAELKHPAVAAVNEIIYAYDDWIVMKNAFPYDRTKKHLLLFPRAYKESVSDMNEGDWIRLGTILFDLEEEFPGGFVLGRTKGDKNKSVVHLHWHYIIAK